jgi:hypothetical protein
MAKAMELDVKHIINLAVENANMAGDLWLANAKPRYEVYASDLNGKRLSESTYMLDLCGGAYVEFRDARKKAFKQFEKAGMIRHGSTINIHHKFRGRQEHGLHLACMEAAKDVLVTYGITDVRVRDYID